MPKMRNFLNENHRGSPILTLLNVLNAQGPIVGLLGLVFLPPGYTTSTSGGDQNVLFGAEHLDSVNANG